jgi:glycosyltransferase involved in cell wall biosynthesis
MKILFLHSFYAPDFVGGAEVVLQSLVEGLAAQGIGVAVLATGQRPGLHREEVNGITVWRAGLRNVYWHKPSAVSRYKLFRLAWRLLDIYNPLMRRYVADVIAAEKPSVASVHNLAGWSVSAWSILLRERVPIVQVLHDYQLMCRGLMFRKGANCGAQCYSCKLMRLPYRQMSSRLSGVVGVSRAVLDPLLKAGYFRAVPDTRVIHNSRTLEELTAQAPSPEVRQKNAPFRFGYIGALAQHKGIELLLRTFAHQPPPNSELWIAGSGDTHYTSTLTTAAAAAPVRFVGQVSAGQFIPSVDVLIVPSLWREPLGTVIIEAMAFGIPVIASSVGGNAEMIGDGINGVLFHPDRPDELSSAMFRLSTEPELRSRMRAAARQASRSFTDRQRFLDEHLNACRAAEKRESRSHVSCPVDTAGADKPA